MCIYIFQLDECQLLIEDIDCSGLQFISFLNKQVDECLNLKAVKFVCFEDMFCNIRMKVWQIMCKSDWNRYA